MSDLPASSQLRTSLAELVLLKTGPFGSALHKSDYVAGGVPVVNPMHIVRGKIVPGDDARIGQDVLERLADFQLAAGDVVLGRRGEMGRCAVVGPGEAGWLCGTGSLILRPLGALEPRYLQRFLSSPEVVERLESESVGSTMVNLNQGILRSIEVPVPPLSEQKRIADKLDAVLARVDACRKRLDRVPGILKRFRQSVLAAATSGELTREWREARDREPSASEIIVRVAEERQRRGLPSGTRSINVEGIEEPDDPLPDTWTWCRVGQVADVRLGGTPPRSEEAYWNGDIPWVSSGEVANSRIADAAEKITQAGLENSNAKLYPRGTVLIAMIGEGKTRGQSALLEIDATTNQNVAGLVFETDFVESEYVWYWALSEYQRTRSVGRGGNQPALNGAKVRALPLPLPPAAEQRAIVERVRGLLFLADEAERRLAAASRATDSLPSTLLAKAFRGELVSQDPNDEPASELLTRLRTRPASSGSADKPMPRGTRAATRPTLENRMKVPPR